MFSPRNRSLLRVALVCGMVALLAVQLGWWLIFFQMNQQAATRVEKRVEMLEESVANREAVPYDLRAGMVQRDGRWVADPAREEARKSRHARQLAMLLAETIFVLAVVGYGSYRVIRSLQREIALIHERGVFLDSVSHELKTPIAGLRLALQTLLRREYSPDQRRELLEGALRDAGRLEEQVTALLTAAGLARLERGARKSPGKCDASACVEAVVAFMDAERRADGDGIPLPALRVSPVDPSASLYVPIDYQLFETVIRNLVRNALLYASESAVIDVSLNLEAGKVVLRVADRGPGIPPAETERVFEPLYRVPGGVNPHRGTGMGLYIVREIVNNAGGAVRARAREGGGTEVEVRLPAVDGAGLSGTGLSGTGAVAGG